MQSGHCPRCAATTLRSNSVSPFGETVFGSVLQVMVYVCMECGYLEWFVPPTQRERLHVMNGWVDMPVAANTVPAYTGATQRLDALDME